MSTNSTHAEMSGLPIFTFTDFGLAGPYIGQVEERIFRIDAGLDVIHLVADAPGFSPVSAGYLLAAVASQCGAGVFLSVVDPGVGGLRKPVVIKCGGQWFVGPDNGLFAPLLARQGESHVFRINYKPEVLSETFHGRDLFAPVAARLAAGIFVALEPIDAPDFGAADVMQARCIVYCDHYGNLMTSIAGDDLEESRSLLLNGELLAHAPRFEAVPANAAFWYVNSLGLVEIAVNRGSARQRFGADVGDPVAIAG